MAKDNPQKSWIRNLHTRYMMLSRPGNPWIRRGSWIRRGPGTRRAPWTRFSRVIQSLTGRRRGLGAFLLGALSAGALPPFFLAPLGILAFSGLFWLLESARRARDSIWVGWLFGSGHFLVSLYWIGNAFLVDSERFAWLIAPALGALFAVLALYPALSCWAAWCWTRNRARHQLWLAFIVTWTLGEWLRGLLFTGFPWNPMGHSLAQGNAVIQTASLTGVWGLSLLAIACATAPALLARKQLAAKQQTRHVWPTILAYAMLGMALAGGTTRLATDDETIAEHQQTTPELPPKLRVVQANIPQAEKWQPHWRQRNIDLHRMLSLESPADEGHVSGTNTTPDIVIWPETAFPYPIDAGVHRIPLFGAAAPDWLIFGGVRIQATDGKKRRLWNSILAVGRTGDIAAVYDKVQLVPFGEYVPLPDWLPIGKLTAGATGFSPGESIQSIMLPNVPPFRPLICYEVIFPHRGGGQSASQSAGGDAHNNVRPQWLLNLTNDAWFGRSAGPYQHLVSARLRAVEQGLPLIRAANTGISAVIDAYGRVRKQIPLGQRGVIDSPLPPATPGITPYGRWGHIPLFALLFFLACIAHWRTTPWHDTNQSQDQREAK